MEEEKIDRKLKRTYVSEITQFLREISNLPGAMSESKLEEVKKYERIFKLRDEVNSADSIEDFL